MKVQNIKHQQYIKSLPVSKILVLEKLGSQELVLKVPKKKPSKKA